MTLVQITYFLEAAEQLSFTKAAENLFISQQAGSKHIKALENELGFALFRREIRQIHLTEEGKQLYALWKRHREEYHALYRDLLQQTSGSRTVRIGIADVGQIVDIALPATVDMERNFPDVEFEHSMGNFYEIQKKLEQDEIDLAITLSTELSYKQDRSKRRMLQYLELGIFLSDKHPLYSRETLTVKELKDETFYMLDDSFSQGASDKILTDTKSKGFIPKKIRSFSNLNQMELALLSGKGISIAYEILFRNTGNGLRMFPLEATPGIEKSDLVIAWNHPQFEVYADTFTC